MADILKYYQDYYKNGGIYKLEDYKNSSRSLMITRWLTDNLKPGAKILDIGCGDGTYSRLLPEFDWTGIDINEEKGDYRGVRIVYDVEKAPYKLEAGSFDAVVCSEVLEHLWSPEGIHREAFRLLKSRGIYVISTPNFDWIEHHLGMFRHVVYNPAESHTKEHIRFYTLQSHEEMLNKSGFRIEDCMGADLVFGRFFAAARQYLQTEVLKDLSAGEIDFILGRCFPLTCHTLGVLSVKP